jgi:two-component system chemotaxis response regulator CheY
MKVLLVDDDEIMRMIVKDHLLQFGLSRIVEAEDGEAAWNALAGGLRPALCCCDILMPKLSGLDFLHRVRGYSRVEKLPLVMITSAADRDSVATAIRCGASGYVVKPFKAPEIRKQLGAVINTARELFAEEPAAVQKRMMVPPQRLLNYFDALETQIVAVREGASGTTESEAHLDGMRTTCHALGLWHAGRIVDELKAQPDSAVATVLLAELAEAVNYQKKEVAERLGV